MSDCDWTMILWFNLTQGFMCAELEWEDGANENDKCTVNVFDSTYNWVKFIGMLDVQASVCCKT